MFLNFLKIFFVKYTLRKNTKNVSNNTKYSTVNSVGLLVDGDCFSEIVALKKALVLNGISKDAIKTLVCKESSNTGNSSLDSTFGLDQFNWKGEVSSPDVKYFLNEKFDLLISYYNKEKPILLFSTNKSNAQFKVGFSNIDKRFNHFTIETPIENYELFSKELLKYMKILNKI
jgi:hypothetical protein